MSARILFPDAARYAAGAGIGPGESEHLVPAKNRWSRVVLPFAGLTPEAWCGLRFRLAWDAEETAGSALDFALAGIDFLSEDGSSLDFDHVPGLDRTLLDPHGAWIVGPTHLPAETRGTRVGVVHLAFRVPAPASRITVTIRSWRNSRTFAVSEVTLTQGAEAPPSPAEIPRLRHRLGPEATWVEQALVPGCGLVLRGQLHTPTPSAHAALARIVYRDRQGEILPPPYPGTISVPALGALIDLSTHQQARRFTLELQPPAGAARVSVGFAIWESGGPEVELLGLPEIALEDRMRLQSLCADDLLDATDFLARLAERLSLPGAAFAGWCPQPDAVAVLPAVLARARAIQRGQSHRAAGLDRTLTLGSAPAWTLPETPDWTEDPFRSVPWRLEYQSLSWLGAIAEAPGGGTTALNLALSWSRANPWGAPADGLALHPAALSARTESFVRLLARAGKPGGPASLTLTGEAVRHGFALAEIVGQNTFGRSIHQVQAAATLMLVARALPLLPLAAHWLALARGALESGVARLIDADGRFFDPSPHQRLELLTLLRALSLGLDPEDETQAAVKTRLDGALAAGLPRVSGLLDPAGRLPPFGDTPHGEDEAGWIGRLGAGASRALVAERWSGQARPRRERPSRPEAPAEPLSGRVDPAAGMIALRHDAPGRGWGHFACTFASQGQGPGHRDAGSFVYACEGVRWVVEAGGSGQVETGAARHHLLSEAGHNVAVPDQRGAAGGPAAYLGATRLIGASVHRLATQVHGPDIAHRRVFLVLDDLSGLAVLDRFAVESGPVGFEGTVHLSPEILLALAGPRRAMAQSGRARLSLSPVTVSGRSAGLTIQNGCNAHPGGLRGFVCAPAGGLQPTNALRYAFASTGAGSVVCGGLALAADADADRRLTALLAEDALARLLAEA
ncbi:heparinase II/III family protein [Methylobacterium sp. J-068]|uniref:heparinase II/III domain-containing protein n=1 Tax=Methylobacterium sp. J-068 TaxID=2836649 RepID=UPI001FB897B0|nr:heparinase II/III family protein [Methylobacterium sp. J-068]MCJ2036263.1 heparinase II/III-family protein [Methylobacterium sp. J-068]